MTDWSDLNDLLADQADRLKVALEGCDIEGPLFEAGELSICLSRRVGDVCLSAQLGIEASEEAVPPDPLQINVGIVENHAFKPPSNLVVYPVTGAVMAGAAAIAFLVWRWTGGTFLPIVAGLVSLMGLLVVALFLQNLGKRRPDLRTSPEFLSLVAAVEKQLPK